MILLTRTALAQGVRVGCWMAAGVASGLIVHAAIAVGGVAYLIASNPIVEKSMKCAAAAYLFWIAIQLVKAAAKSEEIDLEAEKRSAISSGKAWLKGFMCNILNAKVAVFLASMMLPFLSSGVDKPSWWGMLLGAIIVVEGWLLWSLWVLLLQQKHIRKAYLKVWRWIDRGFAVALVVLAGGLLFSL